jgi:hypothetical protein
MTETQAKELAARVWMLRELRDELLNAGCMAGAIAADDNASAIGADLMVAGYTDLIRV